jgi:hypothetical protein
MAKVTYSFNPDGSLTFCIDGVCKDYVEKSPHPLGMVVVFLRD